MPYPSQIDLDAIVQTATTMLEADGVDRLSLNKLSAALGVKTPSLYRYVKNRTDLLRAVNDATERALFDAIRAPLVQPGSPQNQLMRVAEAFWDFAHAHPVTYGLLFTNTIPELRPNSEDSLRSVLQFQRLMAEISGEDQSLTALRGLLALMHGFIMLVLAGQLQRGGDLRSAFLQSVVAYLEGWGRR